MKEDDTRVTSRVDVHAGVGHLNGDIVEGCIAREPSLHIESVWDRRDISVGRVVFVELVGVDDNVGSVLGGVVESSMEWVEAEEKQSSKKQ